VLTRVEKVAADVTRLLREGGRVLGPEHPGTRETQEGLDALDALVELMDQVRQAEQSPSQEAVANEATLRQRLLRRFRRGELRDSAG